MEIVNFLRDNWQFISTAILILFYFFIALISKKKKVIVEDGLLSRIYTSAINLINIAESKFKKGDDKLNYVVNTLVELFPNYSELIGDEVAKKVPWGNVTAKEAFTALVEEILSTPQKKGVK